MNDLSQSTNVNDHSSNFGDRYFEYDLNGKMIRQATINKATLSNYKSQISNFEWPDQGRIKHYYNGSQRLASRIGGGFAPHPDLNHYDPLTDQVELPNSGDYHHKALALVELWTRQAECAGLQPSLEFSYSLAEGNLHNSLSEPADGERYFYHSDHLGSSAFITTENGYATQFLAYLPFGETLDEQQNSSNYYSPFKFSAKEKDVETGYSYFGARYYSPELSVWLSVDPMSDEAPAWTPYRYGFQNPVKYIDPNGMFEDEASARAYAKEHGIKTGLFRSNKIVRNEDGSWSIENRKEHFSISNFGSDIGIRKGILVEGERNRSRKNENADISSMLGLGTELFENASDQVRKEIITESIVSRNVSDANKSSWKTLSKFSNIASVAGKVIGLYGAYDSSKELLNDPSNPANWVKFAANTGTLFLKTNPATFVVSLSVTLLDQGGYIDEWIGNKSKKD